RSTGCRFATASVTSSAATTRETSTLAILASISTLQARDDAGPQPVVAPVPTLQTLRRRGGQVQPRLLRPDRSMERRPPPPGSHFRLVVETRPARTRPLVLGQERQEQHHRRHEE